MSTKSRDPARRQAIYDCVMAGELQEQDVGELKFLTADQLESLAETVGKRLRSDALFVTKVGMWGRTRKDQKHSDQSKNEEQQPATPPEVREITDAEVAEWFRKRHPAGVE